MSKTLFSKRFPLRSFVLMFPRTHLFDSTSSKSVHFSPGVFSFYLNNSSKFSFNFFSPSSLSHPFETFPFPHVRRFPFRRSGAWPPCGDRMSVLTCPAAGGFLQGPRPGSTGQEPNPSKQGSLGLHIHVSISTPSGVGFVFFEGGGAMFDISRGGGQLYISRLLSIFFAGGGGVKASVCCDRRDRQASQWKRFRFTPGRGVSMSKSFPYLSSYFFSPPDF